MKYRCQCGKPKVLSLMRADKHMFCDGTTSILLPTDLHFKAADRFCERCGAPLCEDCVFRKTVRLTDPYTSEIFFVTRYYCQTCAELEEQ